MLKTLGTLYHCQKSSVQGTRVTGETPCGRSPTLLPASTHRYIDAPTQYSTRVALSSLRFGRSQYPVMVLDPASRQSHALVWTRLKPFLNLNWYCIVIGCVDTLQRYVGCVDV